MKPVQFFWGGVDISSALYGEKASPYTQKPNINRDTIEIALIQRCIRDKIPMIGICRGAQLLNVVNGGKLLQHITNHDGTHIISTHDGYELRTNSTHHQMMLPSNEAEVYATCHSPSQGWINGEMHDLPFTYEVLYYPKTKSLCVQFHPEWMDSHSEAILWLKRTVKTLFNQDISFNDWNDIPYGAI